MYMSLQTRHDMSLQTRHDMRLQTRHDMSLQTRQSRLQSRLYKYIDTYSEIIEIGASKTAPTNPEQISHDHRSCCMHVVCMLYAYVVTERVRKGACLSQCIDSQVQHVCFQTCMRGVFPCTYMYTRCMYVYACA